MIANLLRRCEMPALVAVPVVLGCCAWFGIEQAALLTLFATIVSVAVFFASYEASAPALRQIVPTVVLAAIAAAGRILFAPIPGFKPVAAICILTGMVFGKRSGFMVGALAALVSNFFFGHGPWTPWQMYAWGLVGYCAGVLAERGMLERPAVLVAYGVAGSLAFGFIMTSWFIVGYANPISWQTALAAYGAGLPFDCAQAIATALILLAVRKPWERKLARIKAKYALC